jgi:hypothetical protein
MTLCLVPEILNNIDMILLVCKEFRMVDAEQVQQHIGPSAPPQNT